MLTFELQDAGRRRPGTAQPAQQLDMDRAFHDRLTQMRRRWNVQQAATGQYHVDLAIPLGPQWQLTRGTEQPDSCVDLLQVLCGADCPMAQAGLMLVSCHMQPIK